MDKKYQEATEIHKKSIQVVESVVSSAQLIGAKNYGKLAIEKIESLFNSDMWGAWQKREGISLTDTFSNSINHSLEIKHLILKGKGL